MVGCNWLGGPNLSSHGIYHEMKGHVEVGQQQNPYTSLPLQCVYCKPRHVPFTYLPMWYSMQIPLLTLLCGLKCCPLLN